MKMYDIIAKKRNGFELSAQEIEFFIKGYTVGDIPDYQASALMMAIFFNGMTDTETVTLTNAMANSGDTLDLSTFGSLSVDKHSTGGVGDKTTLIISPIVAALGCKVTKMSGRGLGHTGGTVDKLESIPGYRTELSESEFIAQAEKVGLVIIGQTGNFAPADKKLYALRDVTATVDSIPLIASSIMSKKLAAGSHSIVLDVKYGSGAFMKTAESAKVLAQKMVDIGKLCGKNMTAILTDMSSPLGNNVGNALEVIEAIDVLKGEKKGDLFEVCVTLATNMVALALNKTEDESRQMVFDCIESKNAFNKMKEWVNAQGGDVRYLEDTSLFAKSEYTFDVCSKSDGYITSMDAQAIGNVSVMLGAGRSVKTDIIDHSAGIIIHKKTGEKVCKGDVLCTLYTNAKCQIDVAGKKYLSAITVEREPLPSQPLVYGVIR